MNDPSVQSQGEAYLYDDGGAPPVSMGLWFKAAWRRKWLMLLLFALVMGGGVLFTRLQKPVYEASAWLKFSGRSPGAFRAEVGEQVTGSFVSGQIPFITRETTLSEITRDPQLGPRISQMFQGETDLVQALKECVHVSLLKEAPIINISVQGEDSRLITAIANKIADNQRMKVENDRDMDVRAGVREYVKKMADMSSDMNAMSLKMWTRANNAAIAGLTFNEQQRDGRVIVAAFQRQSAALLAQRAEARKQFDQATADLAASETHFDAECTALLREAGPESKPAVPPKPADAPAPAASSSPAATGTTNPAPAVSSSATATTASADPAGKPAVEPEAMVTAAQFASKYQQLLKVEQELDKSPATARAAALEKRRGEIMVQVDDLRRRFQVQSQHAQEAMQAHAIAQDKAAKQAERIAQIEEALEVRKMSLSSETYSQDFEVKALLERKATLEAQYETERKKLDEQLARLATWPQILEQAQKIQQLEKAADVLHALRLTRKIYGENYFAVQAALDALTGPLNDILNDSAKYDRIEQDYLKMDEWVRDVKLALSQISVTVQEATVPTIPIRPKWPINIALSGLLGLMSSVGVAMLLEFGRKTVKTPSDAKRRLGAPVLGVVPHFRRLDFGKGVFSLDALKDSHIVETFNEVRFYIQAAGEGKQPRSILITSAAAREGKSTVATLLAHSLARSGEKVLLVDANMRLPYLHSVFQCEDQPGLADILQNGNDLSSCVRPTDIPNLSLMTAGGAGEDGLAWVRPERFAQFIRAATESFDHVILDCTSTIGVADVRMIASGVDAVLYVVQADRLKGALVSRGIEHLRHARANLLGVVLNNARYTKGDHYYFHKRAITRNGHAKNSPEEEPAESGGEEDEKQ